jgi:hypothetical protein
MQLAISNIAWSPEDTDAVYEVLSEIGVGGLEIAPGVLFAAEPDPFDPSEEARGRRPPGFRSSRCNRCCSA